MPTSHHEVISKVLDLVVQIQPTSVLDIGVGFGKMGVLCREYLDIWQRRIKPEDWQIQIDGLEIFQDYKNSIHESCYNTIYYENVMDRLDLVGQYDLVLMLDVIEHLTKDDAAMVLEAINGAYIISTPQEFHSYDGGVGGNDYERHISRWYPSEFKNVILMDQQIVAWELKENNKMNTWDIAQKHEREWWGDVQNTYFEEEKQLKYAQKMGLVRKPSSKTPYIFDMSGKKVLDIGGGPTSLLLKCENVHGVIIDPLEFPEWVQSRYKDVGIEYIQDKGENISVTGFDEVWVYNVLQHADVPEKVIQNARKAGKLVRIFEWVDTPPNPTHPNKLLAEELDSWLGGQGTVEETEGGRIPAKMYYGQFAGIADCTTLEKVEEMKVHFVTTGPEFPYIYYLGIMTAIKAYGDKVVLWYTEEPQGEYFEFLRDKVDMKEVVDLPDFPALVDIDSHLRRVSIFDYAVWQAVYKHGGIIMGLDSLTLKPHLELLHPDKEMLAPIDASGTTYFGMHGVIVRKGSQLAKKIIDDALVSLNDGDRELKWGDAGMTPYVHRSRANLDKLSLAPFQTVCGRHPELFTEDAALPNEAVRTIALYNSSNKVDIDINEEYIEGSQSPYAKCVKAILSKEEWQPSELDVQDSVITPHTTRNKRFHLLGLSHVAANQNELCCAFSQKVVKMGKMLKSMGHTVFVYGVEGSDVECDEFIQISTQAIIDDSYGVYDTTKETYRHDIKSNATKVFNENGIVEIRKRMQSNDFLLIPFSPATYKPLIDNLRTNVIDSKDKLKLIVEMGIGYRGTYCPYRVFESVSQQHLNYGLAGQENGSNYDAVIPNYFDPADFTYSEEKDDYFLFLGRVVKRKGVATAVETTRMIGSKLIVAGQQAGEDVDLSPPHVEYVGFADVEKRRQLLSRAKCLILPTTYIEPFGGVIIEAALSGTPVITTNWGAFPELVKHGKTGYRCQTLDQFVWAAKNIDTIKPKVCYDYGINNFSLERVKLMYEEYWDMLLDVKENVDKKGWSRIHPERQNLDWLVKEY